MRNQDFDFVDEQRAADMLDALADLEEEKQAALAEYYSSEEGEDPTHQTDPSDWLGYEGEISKEERNACDHYNERFVVSVW